MWMGDAVKEANGHRSLVLFAHRISLEESVAHHDSLEQEGKRRMAEAYELPIFVRGRFQGSPCA